MSIQRNKYLKILTTEEFSENAVKAELVRWFRNVHLRVRSSDEFEKLVGILAHDWFGVVASNVVPLDAILINIVKDSCES